MSGIISLLCDHTFQVVALGSAILGAVSGVLGSFAVLRRQSLMGDGISHAALPGVVAAFLLTGSKSTGVLLAGALASGLAAAMLIVGIVRVSRVKFDSALALVMSSLFGVGLMLLTVAQKCPDANQAGLKQFLYGQASALLGRDVALMAVGGAALLLIVLLLWTEFQLLSFDPEYAKSIGLPVNRLNLLLSLLLVGNILIGLQTVGVVLMSAMLIAPAVAARQWTDRLGMMALLAAGFGAVSGAAGTLISSAEPELPTGPLIVICATVFAGFSLLFAPGRGVLCRRLQRKRRRNGLHRKGGERLCRPD